MIKREFEARDVFMWRLPHGADLFDRITGFAEKEGITMGTVSAIGAVSENLRSNIVNPEILSKK